MPDKFDYYMVRQNHDEIFKKFDPCSFHELLFAVEAPKHISNINIWYYTELMNIEDICVDSKPITQDEINNYPFYELFTHLWNGNLMTPLIFEEIDGELHCIEGRHRLRVISLIYKSDPKEFELRIGKIPVIVVKKVDRKTDGYFPDKYNDWISWLELNHWKKKAEHQRAFYEKFLYN